MGPVGIEMDLQNVFTTLRKDLGLRPVGAGVVIVRDADGRRGVSADVQATGLALAHHSGLNFAVPEQLIANARLHRRSLLLIHGIPRGSWTGGALGVGMSCHDDDWQVALHRASANPAPGFFCAWAEQGIWRGGLRTGGWLFRCCFFAGLGCAKPVVLFRSLGHRQGCQ